MKRNVQFSKNNLIKTCLRRIKSWPFKMNFEAMLNQVFQPYFYYSVISLVISFICVKILTKYCSFISNKTKSFLFLTPLILPLVVMIIFNPSTVIQTTTQRIATFVMPNAIQANNVFSTAPVLPPSSMPVGIIVSFLTITVPSYTGIICIIGLILGGLFALLITLADDRITRRMLHVILLSPNEQPWLKAKVDEASQKLKIVPPKIGIVEDLRPNAFTIGYGHRATIVFSIGLFNILKKEELEAVVSHELAHVKNQDFFFKTLSNALTMISFFNPIAYIASSTAQREREMFADEQAILTLKRPEALADALAKICVAIQTLPKEGALTTFSSNLIVASSIIHKADILATHPKLDKRIKNISLIKPGNSHWNMKNKWYAILLSLLLVSSAVAVMLAMASLQASYASTQINLTPTVLNLGSEGLSSVNGPPCCNSIILHSNSTQYMVVQTYQPIVVMGNGSNTFGNVQYRYEGGFVVVFQNSTSNSVGIFASN